LNLDPIFGSDVNLSIASNFCNYGFFSCHWKNGFSIFLVAKMGKTCVFCEVATKGIIHNSTTLIFTYRGPCRKARSRVSWIFSTCSHILNYFWAKPF
jgi:hypothetical protein